MKDIACECVSSIGIFLNFSYFSISYHLRHCISTVMNKNILYFHLKHKQLLLSSSKCEDVLISSSVAFFEIVIIY